MSNNSKIGRCSPYRHVHGQAVRPGHQDFLYLRAEAYALAGAGLGGRAWNGQRHRLRAAADRAGHPDEAWVMWGEDRRRGPPAPRVPVVVLVVVVAGAEAVSISS